MINDAISKNHVRKIGDKGDKKRKNRTNYDMQQVGKETTVALHGNEGRGNKHNGWGFPINMTFIEKWFSKAEGIHREE